MKTTDFKEVVSQIKDLKIQGAESIAIEAANSLFLILKNSNSVTKEALIAELYHARMQLSTARPTEPCLRNTLEYIFFNINTYDDDYSLPKNIVEMICNAISHFQHAKERIVNLGASKIRHNSVVFTHCHSSTVVAVLHKAKKQGKRFIVYNTETRPLWQGRKTATELAKLGIPVKHFVDSAAAVAMNDAHICLFGADAITQQFIYNKIGSGMFAELLAARHIPLYICSNAWKYDPFVTKKHHENIEQRGRAEVWDHAPQTIDIHNPAFEEISVKYVSAIISELGVLSIKSFSHAIERAYPWLFQYHQ